MKIDYTTIEELTGRAFDNESDLLAYVQRAISYLGTHNKNLTNAQYHKVCDLENIFSQIQPEDTAPKLRVCAHCLAAIESREGPQLTRTIYLDEDDPTPCDWCEEALDDVLYEIQ